VPDFIVLNAWFAPNLHDVAVLIVTGDAICQQQKPCVNGGQCRPLLGDYYCDCRENTTGRNCERSIARLLVESQIFSLQSRNIQICIACHMAKWNARTPFLKLHHYSNTNIMLTTSLANSRKCPSSTIALISYFCLTDLVLS